MRRREFLGLAVASGALAALPIGCGGASGAGAAHFFDPAERELLESLAAAIVPDEEGLVGAVGAGAIDYVERLLTAFDRAPAAVYASGPFSGRTPYPDPETGAPSDVHPANDFRDVLPLSRLAQLAWRIELDGSASVPNGDVNAGVVEAWPGLRALYREALADLREQLAALGVGRLGDLPPEERLALFEGTAAEFQDAFVSHLAEGMFGAPEYGGNADGIAWCDYGYDGDSQPLGHTLYDPRTQTVRDRPDQPNSTADPEPGALARTARGPLDDPLVLAVLERHVLAHGGRRFY